MTSFKRNLVWLLPLLVLAVSPVWWQPLADFLRPRVTVPGPVGAAGPLENFTMINARLVQARQGREEFSLQAGRVNSGGRDALYFEDIEARVHDKRGRETLMTGGEAVFNVRRQILTVLDRVRVWIPGGGGLETEALRYLVRYRKVKSAEDVRMSSPGRELRGGSFSYDLVKGRLRVGGRVRVDLL